MSAEWSISGKVCIVTGANSGIGKVTALELARRGAAKVIMACRNLKLAEDAAVEIREKVGYANEAEAKQRVFVKKLDLSSLQSVREFAQDINANEQALHVLVNNAGLEQPKKNLSADGYELTFATNHLGHFLLTNLLMDLLKRSRPSRVINVASMMYMMRGWGGLDLSDINFEHTSYGSGAYAYAQSKLANILHSRELHRRHNIQQGQHCGVSFFCLHPGVIHSDFLRYREGCDAFLASLVFLTAISVEEGAKTTLLCACQPAIEHQSGLYFDKEKVKNTWACAQDDAKAKELWELSERMIAAKQ